MDKTVQETTVIRQMQVRLHTPTCFVALEAAEKASIKETTLHSFHALQKANHEHSQHPDSGSGYKRLFFRAGSKKLLALLLKVWKGGSQAHLCMNQGSRQPVIAI